MPDSYYAHVWQSSSLSTASWLCKHGTWRNTQQAVQDTYMHPLVLPDVMSAADRVIAA